MSFVIGKFDEMKFNYFWRQIETGDANKIEFIRGGEKPLRFMGWLNMLVMCIFCVWVFFQWVPAVHYAISNFLRMKEYRLAVFWYFIGGLPIIILLEPFVFGIWMVFGRVIIIVDKTLGTITKDYRLRAFSLYRRNYQAGDLSSISFRRIDDVRRILSVSALYLHRKDGTSAKLLLAPKKYQDEGRMMATQIADFLGIQHPGQS